MRLVGFESPFGLGVLDSTDLSARCVRDAARRRRPVRTASHGQDVGCAHRSSPGRRSSCNRSGLGLIATDAALRGVQWVGVDIGTERP